MVFAFEMCVMVFRFNPGMRELTSEKANLGKHSETDFSIPPKSLPRLPICREAIASSLKGF
jgi:hypothetical protein